MPPGLTAAAALPLPPINSKPQVAAAPTSAAKGQSDSKSSRVIPAVPLASPAARPAKKPSQLQPATVHTPPQADLAKPGLGAAEAARNQQTATTQAATAAVAAAMAKLTPANLQNQKNGPDGAIDNLTRKVNDMRTDDRIRNSRHPGTGGYAAGHRGRGGPRRGGREQGKGIVVPKSDYDFESANAKFRKHQSLKDGTPVDSPDGSLDAVEPATNGNAKAEDSTTDGAADVAASTTPLYNSSSSFFHTLSSDMNTGV